MRHLDTAKRSAFVQPGILKNTQRLRVGFSVDREGDDVGSGVDGGTCTAAASAESTRAAPTEWLRRQRPVHTVDALVLCAVERADHLPRCVGDRDLDVTSCG